MVAGHSGRQARTRIYLQGLDATCQWKDLGDYESRKSYTYLLWIAVCSKHFVAVVLILYLIFYSAVVLKFLRLELFCFLSIWILGVAKWPSG